jgi:hypothetical protein
MESVFDAGHWRFSGLVIVFYVMPTGTGDGTHYEAQSQGKRQCAGNSLDK